MPRTRAWSPATSSTPRRGSSRSRRPARSSSARRRSARPLGAIAFEPAGEQALKGKAAPVPAWRASRRRRARRPRSVATRSRRRSSAATTSSGCSRTCSTRPAASGGPGWCRVIGPAGIGKSRLAWEFLKYVDGLVETVCWHDGRSPGLRRGHHVLGARRDGPRPCGLLETDDEATTRAKVAAIVAEHVPDDDERRWIEPALLALLGHRVGRSASEQLFAAWRTFFERLAADGARRHGLRGPPLGRPGLLDFVDHLLEWSRGVPIYVVTLARPELLDRRPTGAPAKRNFASLYLEPLPEAAMRELLAGLVPGPARAGRPGDRRARRGHPAVRRRDRPDARRRRPPRSLARRRVSAGRRPDDARRPRDADRPDRLPARRPRARPTARSCSDAAVLGQSFTVAALAGGLRDRDAATLSADAPTRSSGASCPDARGRPAVARSAASTPSSRRSSARSPTTRSPERDRKIRHLAAARYFEALGSDELAGALAGHYLAAYAQRRRRARRPTRSPPGHGSPSGRRPSAPRGLGAHDAGHRPLEQALTVTADPADQAALHERIGNSALAIQLLDLVDPHFPGRPRDPRGRWAIARRRPGPPPTMAGHSWASST